MELVGVTRNNTLVTMVGVAMPSSLKRRRMQLRSNACGFSSMLGKGTGAEQPLPVRARDCRMGAAARDQGARHARHRAALRAAAQDAPPAPLAGGARAVLQLPGRVPRIVELLTGGPGTANPSTLNPKP